MTVGTPAVPFGRIAADFRWAVGIEDTFVPQIRSGMRSLDEYELMGHYDSWRDDLRQAQATGARMLRWGIPWYRVEPEQGRFDWTWTDQVIPYIVDELGLEPILDLMHYGTPLWLARSFAAPRYPEAVAAYARAVAERYGNRIRYYTPLNEPLINALYCGKRGVWPPYLRGDSGYVKLALALAKGIVCTIQAIKAVVPQACMIHVEAAGLWRAAREELQPLTVEQQRRGYLFYDLVTGLVDPQHPLYEWLVAHGAAPADLQWLRDQAVAIDVMGLNFYPEWSTKQISLDARDRPRYRNVEQDGAGFAHLINDFYTRYRAPIMITETSARRGIEVKQRWLDASVVAVRQLRSAGVPVIGYTWFPLYTMVRWAYRTGNRPRNDYLIELGLYESQVDPAGNLRCVPTPLVEQFARLTRDSERVVGDLRS